MLSARWKYVVNWRGWYIYWDLWHHEPVWFPWVPELGRDLPSKTNEQPLQNFKRRLDRPEKHPLPRRSPELLHENAPQRQVLVQGNRQDRQQQKRFLFAQLLQRGLLGDDDEGEMRHHGATEAVQEGAGMIEGDEASGNHILRRSRRLPGLVPRRRVTVQAGARAGLGFIVDLAEELVDFSLEGFDASIRDPIDLMSRRSFRAAHGWDGEGQGPKPYVSLFAGL